MTGKNQEGTDTGHDGGAPAQQLDIPAPTQGEKGDQELEVEIGRSYQQLQDEGLVPPIVQNCIASGQFHKGNGRLEQLIKCQPQILDVAFLGDIKRQQEERQHCKQDAINEPGNALEEAVDVPVFERSIQFFRITQAHIAIGKESGVGSKPGGEEDRAQHQGHRGLGGVQLQLINASDLLITLGRVSVRPLGANLPAVGEDIRAQHLLAGGGIFGGRQLDDQHQRPVVGRELDMQPEPGEGPLVAFGAACVVVPVECAGGMILIGNLGKGFLCIADGPCGVVELGSRRSRVGGDSDSPAFVEKQR